mgnify:CR=1 FL=1
MKMPEVEPLLASMTRALQEKIRTLPKAPAMVGIHTGGAWVAQALHTALGLPQPLGLLDISFYRDDFEGKGLHPRAKPSSLPFAVDDQHIILVDEVVMTGRTIRAALNELFDYGRPAQVELAVLVDRGGRELPIAATYCPHVLPQPLPGSRSLDLARDAQGQLSFSLSEK